MIKWVLVICALFGAWALLHRYAPATWAHGLTVQGYFVPVAGMILAGVLFLGYKLKG